MALYTVFVTYKDRDEEKSIEQKTKSFKEAISIFEFAKSSSLSLEVTVMDDNPDIIKRWYADL